MSWWVSDLKAKVLVHTVAPPILSSTLQVVERTENRVLNGYRGTCPPVKDACADSVLHVIVMDRPMVQRPV